MAYQLLHSVLGVGFGPANLSLAVALAEVGRSGGTRFVERASGFQWQEEQLLPGTDIQNNPFRDLAMPRNPDSPYTFVKYLAARRDLIGSLILITAPNVPNRVMVGGAGIKNGKVARIP